MPMDMHAYTVLWEIIKAGAFSVFSLQALFSFLLFLLFTYGAAMKEGEPLRPFYDILWVALPTLLSFILSAVALFILREDLTSIIVAGFTLSTLLSVSVAVIFVLLAVWIFMPVRIKNRAVYDDDEDLSSAPLWAMLFGCALSGFVFINATWPPVLLMQIDPVESLHQSAFYAFFYFLSFALLWILLWAVTYTLIGRFIVANPPVKLTALLLVFASIFQVSLFFL